MSILVEHSNSTMQYPLFRYKYSPSHVTIVRGAVAYYGRGDTEGCIPNSGAYKNHYTRHIRLMQPGLILYNKKVIKN